MNPPDDDDDNDELSLLSRHNAVRIWLPIVVVLAVVLWATNHFLEPAPPRRIVLASGAEFGTYHAYAKRYRQILAREGVLVEERMTSGAADNVKLLRDPKSGVDIAFMQGGIATPADEETLEMVATLYYEPLWIFYRDAATLTRLNELAGKRIAVGVPGSGTRAFVTSLLEANGMTGGEADLVPIGGTDALGALREGRVDAALFVGGATTPLIQDALRDPALKLMSLERADAYARRYPYLTRLTLPPGTIDFVRDIPARNVDMIGTKAMLVGRDSLHPALADLLFDAAREIHSGQGVFEAAGEFPGTSPVDIPVSTDADRHRRFGPGLIRRIFPFWVATVLERTIILIVPLLAILIPLINYLPQVLRTRVRARVYRWYGELALLERDIETRTGTPPIERWRRNLDRIEQAVAHIHIPPSVASEAYTLREHIGIVRRAVEARAAAMPAASAPEVGTPSA